MINASIHYHNTDTFWVQGRNAEFSYVASNVTSVHRLSRSANNHSQNRRNERCHYCCVRDLPAHILYPGALTRRVDIRLCRFSAAYFSGVGVKEDFKLCDGGEWAVEYTWK
jgi:hypothetical protein